VARVGGMCCAGTMNESAKTLILGATGTVGRRVVGALRQADPHAHIVSAARRMPPSPSAVRFDWADAATWPTALDGVEELFVMAPDGVPVEEGFVALAVERGVRRIVLLSSRGIEVMGDERLLDAERIVREAGVEHTIVRPDWYDQNFSEGVLRDAVLSGVVALPVGGYRAAFTDCSDVAAVVAEALRSGSYAGETLELGGPRALDFSEATAIVAAASGLPVVFLGDEQDYLDAMADAGVPVEQLRAEVAAFAALRDAGHSEPGNTVERVTGREPISFERFAAEAAGAGAWEAR
jgi:uncharacterized protein YbjT (DUF2867 family)